MKRKPQISIIKDKEGKLKRILVEQKVKSIEPILKLQNEISKVNSNFQPEIPEKLHMTLAHFGIPRELYNDFQKVNPDLTFNRFLKELYKLIQTCCDVEIEGTEVQAEGLDIFGASPHNVAVLKITKSPERKRKREDLILPLERFVANLGVENVKQFMLHSPNLKYNPSNAYNPHITLGYVGENTTLPEIDVSDLKIIFHPSEVSGIEIESQMP